MATYIPPHMRTAVAVAANQAVQSAADWVRSHQVASAGPIGKVVGMEQPPAVQGWMYRMDGETEGNNMNTERTLFDAQMGTFRANRGPPPAPLMGGRGCPLVGAYNSWYSRVGAGLAAKWEREHPVAPRRPAAPTPAPAPRVVEQPKVERPARPMEISAQSGW